MSRGWQRVQLREVVAPVQRPEVPLPGTSYRQLGVRLWGEGAYERETVDGGSTKYRTLARVEPDDLVVNKIWARNGSVAVVPAELAGCYVSGEFPSYVANGERVSARWLHWLTKTPGVWAQCDAKSQGTSGKNRIRPEEFLSVEIPLPPLAEQQRIVARIENLAGTVDEAGTLREAATKEAQALWASCLRARMSGAAGQDVPLENVCEAIIDNLHSNPRYTETGVPCVRSPDVGWGSLDLKGARRTDEEEYRRRTVRGEPREDDVVLVREGGGTGKAALVLPGNRFSLGQRVMMLRPDKTKVVPKFFLYQLLSPRVQEDQIRPLSKGSASPHLNIGALKTFTLRLPTMAVQHTVVDELDRLRVNVRQLDSQQKQTRAELAALLPAILDRAFKGML